MTDSEFWHDLESRLRSLQPELRHDLHADWISTAWNEAGEQWFISGGPDKRTRTTFEWLAERGALRLGHRGGSEAVFCWLGLLKRDSPLFRMNGNGSSWHNGKETHYKTGSIECLCEASADYCIKLENDTIANYAPTPVLPAASITSRKCSSNAVELGQGGVKFVRRGEFTLAEPCDRITGSSTVSAVRVSYDILCAELPKVYSLVKAKSGISASELRKQFRSSQLAKVTDRGDWEGWIEDFSASNRNRGRPKSAALTFLERKMSLNRSTLKTYVSKSKKLPNR